MNSQNILNKIRGLIRIVTVNKHSDKRSLEIDSFDVEDKKVVALVPYGLFCKIKSKINGLSFQQEGQEDSLFVMPIDVDNIDDLDDDELAVGIPSRVARVKFDKDGNIFLNSEDGSSYIELDKDGNLKGEIEGTIDITDGYSNTIVTTSDQKIKLNDVMEISQ